MVLTGYHHVLPAAPRPAVGVIATTSPPPALQDTLEGTRRFMDRLSLFGRAVSLGNAESLVMHPASQPGPRPPGARPEAPLTESVGDDLIRVSVGLEDVVDLLDDLRHGLAGV
jgi:methionine-gamma-lyase